MIKKLFPHKETVAKLLFSIILALSKFASELLDLLGLPSHKFRCLKIVRKNLVLRQSHKTIAVFLVISIFANFISNDKPIIFYYKNHIYFPIFQNITEKTVGGNFETKIDFKDKELQEIIAKNDENSWYLWPINRYSYDTINYKIKSAAPSKPDSDNILGTDDQARDLLARIIYGFRTSLFFGLILTSLTFAIAIFIGAVQGFYGGFVDLIFQRIIEIWSSVPALFLLIIISTLIKPSFISLILLLLMFNWIGLSNLIRAEFLRLKNLEFVMAAKVLGASDFRIITKHILPSAMPVIISNLPFVLSGSIIILTSLDFLGLGLYETASLGEILAQGKNNLNAPWIALSGFFTLTIFLTCLMFIAEKLRKN